MGNITTLGKQHHQAPNLGVRARLGPIMHEMPDSHKNGWIPSQAFHSDKRTNSKILTGFSSSLENNMVFLDGTALPTQWALSMLCKCSMHQVDPTMSC